MKLSGVSFCGNTRKNFKLNLVLGRVLVLNVKLSDKIIYDFMIVQPHKLTLTIISLNLTKYSKI